MGYDEQSGTLVIYFRKHKKGYRFKNVPDQVYQELMAAPSKGVYFNKFIRNKYDFEPIEPDHVVGG